MDKDTQLLLIAAVGVYLLTRDRRPAYQSASPAKAANGSSSFLADIGSIIEKGIGAWNSYEDRAAARELARRKQEREDKSAAKPPTAGNDGFDDPGLVD